MTDSIALLIVYLDHDLLVARRGRSWQPCLRQHANSSLDSSMQGSYHLPLYSTLNYPSSLLCIKGAWILLLSGDFVKKCVGKRHTLLIDLFKSPLLSGIEYDRNGRSEIEGAGTYNSSIVGVWNRLVIQI